MSQHGCPERLSSRSKGFQEEGSQPTMEVLVETLTGTAFEMTVSPSDTIFAIKSKICRVEGIPVSQQHLVYRLRELEDAWSLGALGIADGARLRLVLGMRGGPVSTRRLPPPQPWHDIERLLHSNREDGEWSTPSSGSCRVTVVVFRDGERVNMLRVRENKDGTYSPIDHAKYSSSLTHLEEQDSERSDSAAASGHSSGQAGQNALTMGKMMDLRRRMESLSLRRNHHTGEKPEIQKTRSEETLSVPSLVDEPLSEFSRAYSPFCSAEDGFPDATCVRRDCDCMRRDCDCVFADRYTLLPPIGRTDSDLSVQDAVVDVQGDSDLVKVSEGLAGSILVQGAGLEAHSEEALEPVPCRDAVDIDCHHLAHDVPATDYGPLVGGGSCWRVVGFGSSSQLAEHTHTHAHSHSASSLHAHAHTHTHTHTLATPKLGQVAMARAHPPLSDTALSVSTSELETLRRHRLLPALSRHRNTEHLHLSDDSLHLPRLNPPAPQRDRKPRLRCAWCRKKLSVATVHECRCGARYCAPHRYAEVHGCRYDYKAHQTTHTDNAKQHNLPPI